MRRIITCIVAAITVVASGSQPLPLKVVGKRLLNSQNRPVLLRGLNCATLEWASDGEGHILDTIKVGIEQWHANVIRLPVSQDRWFGTGPEQKDRGVAYRKLVRQAVDEVARRGCYLLLDLQWSDGGVWGQSIGQHVMPDKNSATFWSDAARTFRNEPAVIFDLYNEPHDVTWDIWLKGGTVTEKAFRGNPARTYQAVGMQELLDTVRRTGAENVCIAGGLDWAYDFSGILAGRQLSDPLGHGVLYPNHVYNNKGESVAKWLKRMETAGKVLPVIVSEFGNTWLKGGDPGEKWMSEVMAHLRSHHYSWVAWDLHPKAGPTLVSDWNYKPTPFGELVKRELVSPERP